MDTILTWSGTASHEIATFFRSWLPGVLPGVEPWISSQDIAKGRPWFQELMEQLARTGLSITFVTPENVLSPWVYFEVGAIAAKLRSAAVCPYLVGVEARQVRDTPLGQFQWTEATESDTLRLVRSINAQLPDGGNDEKLLEGNFNAQWPRLKRQLDLTLESLPPVVEDVVEVEPPVEQQLSEEARRLIVDGSQDPNRQISYHQSVSQTNIWTNGKDMIEDKSPRSVANWEGALAELINFGLLNPVGYKGEVFKVTRKGYEVADRIKSRKP